jgi:DNA replication and repair protein RecF
MELRAVSGAVSEILSCELSLPFALYPSSYLQLYIDTVSNIEFSEDIRTQEKIFYEKLKSSFDNDMRMRTTTKGPHKDDIEFFIENDDNLINVRNFGSQGQQRTAALSLKLAEIDIIKKETGEYPILLLDDVMSELDLERQEFLIKTLSFSQLFITTAEMQEKLIEEFPDATIFDVKKGNVEKRL